MKTPRGIRNNNPFNIRKSNANWVGMSAIQKDDDFVTFDDPIDGIRAGAKLLLNYQEKHNLRTVSQIIHRFAPPNENNTASYIKHVSSRLAVGPNDIIDVSQYDVMKRLVKSIILHENSGQQPYTDVQLDKALRKAGIVADSKPLSKSRTMKGAKATAAVGSIAAVSGAIAEVSPALPVLSTVSSIVKDNAIGFLIVVGLVAVGLAAYIAYVRFDDRVRGLR